MNISQEKSTNWCRKGQRSWKTQHINLCTSKTGYSKIHCSYLPYARVLPFVLRNTHAHQGIVRICEPYCYYRMQRSEGIHGWSLREFPRLATEPSVIQEIPLSMEKSGLQSYNSVVASIITTSRPRFCGFVRFPEAMARRNETTRVIVRKYDRTKLARWASVSIAHKRQTWAFESGKKDIYIIHVFVFIESLFTFMKSLSLSFASVCKICCYNIFAPRILYAIICVSV